MLICNGVEFPGEEFCFPPDEPGEIFLNKFLENIFGAPEHLFSLGLQCSLISPLKACASVFESAYSWQFVFSQSGSQTGHAKFPLK